MESENNKRRDLDLRLQRDKLDLQLTDPNSKHAKELKEKVKNMQFKKDHPKPMTAAYKAVASRLSGNPVTANADVDEALVGKFIRILFELNPKPTDEQIHGAARAINLDPATFESIIYDDFGHMMNGQADALSSDTLYADYANKLSAMSTHNEPGTAFRASRQRLASPLTNSTSDPVSNKGAQANDGTFVEDDAPVVNDGLLDPAFNTDIVDEQTQM
jgi:hypothetical protein